MRARPLGITEVDNGEILHRECCRSRIHAAHHEAIHRRRRTEDPPADDGDSRNLDQAGAAWRLGRLIAFPLVRMLLCSWLGRVERDDRLVESEAKAQGDDIGFVVDEPDHGALTRPQRDIGWHERDPVVSPIGWAQEPGGSGEQCRDGRPG